MKHAYTLTVIVFLAASVTTLAQAPNGSGHRMLTPGKRVVLLGVYGGGGLVSHSGPFNTKEGKFECCTYDDGSGTEFLGGAKAVIPLNQPFFLIPRLAFEILNGAFDSEPFSYPILGQGNTIEPADFENTLDATISVVNIGVHAAYMFTGFGLYASAGPSLSYVLSKDFTATDRLTGPPGVRFVDGSVEKEVVRGDIDITQSTYFSLEASLGAFLEVAPSIYVNPEAMYRLSISSLSREQDWKIGGVQGTIGILLAF